ncbi:MAG: SurA N-terminal domain-containing protein [Synergistaceae bacterium]|nr:SurA N-terminal domain-containing protein [Synergistaceae bacterium]
MMKFLRTQMKWIMALIVVAFLLSTFLMYEGRSTRRSPGPRNADGTMEDYEVATINGRSLMRSELEQRFRNYLNNYSTRSTISLDVAAIYQTVLDQAILESQMAKEVQEQGITVSDSDADRAMKNYADTYFPTREAFYQVLSNSGIKVEDYKKSLARQMANERLLRNAVGEIVVSEDNAVAFYDTMKNFIYSKPEGFNIQLANFKSNQAAEDMRSRLNSGQSWAAIASADVLSSKDVINITKEPVFLPSSALRSGFLSVLDSLDIGQVSPVFSVSSDDFAVALKTEHVAASVTPYNEVSADIKSTLRNQEERRRLTDYQAELMSKAQVVINDKSLFERPVVSEDKKAEEVSPEFVVEEVKESSSDSEVKAQEVPQSKPEEPEVEIAKVSDDSPAPEAKAEVKEVKSEAPVSSGEPEVEIEIEKVSDDNPAPEAEAEAKPEVKEVKSEAPVSSGEPEVEIAIEEVSDDSPAPKAEAEAKPEVKEVKSEAPVSSGEPEVEIAIEEVSEDNPEPEAVSEVKVPEPEIVKPESGDTK